MATIGTLNTIIRADTVPFERGVRRARSVSGQFQKSLMDMSGTLRRVGTTLVATAGVAGFGALIKSSLQAADQVAKTAAKLGESTEALTRLQFAGEQSGVAIATMNMALQRMVRRVSEAAHGTGEAQNAIKELGLDAKELARLSPGKVFEALTMAMARVPSQADKVRLAMKLFDSEGVALVNTMNLGSDGLQELFAQADKLGFTLSAGAAKSAEEASDAINRMTVSVQGAARALATGFGDAIVTLADSFASVIVSMREFAEWVNKTSFGIAGLASKAALIAGVFSAAAFAVVWTTKTLVGYAAAIVGSVRALKSSSAAYYVETAALTRNTAAHAANAAARTRGVGAAVGGSAAGKAVPALTLSPFIGSLSKFSSLLLGIPTIAISAGAAIRQFYLSLTGRGNETIGSKLADSLYDLDEAYRKLNADVDQGQVARYLQEQAAAADAAAKKTKELAEAQDRLRDSINGIFDGVDAAYDQLSDNPGLKKALREIDDAFATVPSGTKIKTRYGELDKSGAIAEVTAQFESLAKDQSDNALRGQVSAFQQQAKNLGKTDFDLVLENLKDRYTSAEGPMQAFWGSQIKAAQDAAYEIKQFEEGIKGAADRASALAQLVGLQVRINDLARAGSGPDRGAGGAFQVGSVEEFSQRRRIATGSQSREKLQEKLNELTKDMLAEMRKQNITSAELLAATREAERLNLP